MDRDSFLKKIDEAVTAKQQQQKQQARRYAEGEEIVKSLIPKMKAIAELYATGGGGGSSTRGWRTAATS
jgi:hypothetical protein